MSEGPFAPGSIGWMIRHELRLNWRYLTSLGGRTRIIVSLVIVSVIALVFGALGGYASRLLTPAMMQRAWPNIAAIIDTGLFFVTTLMLAQALASATIVFYDRGDLDLLLTSPVKPVRILSVRILTMALTSMRGFLLFLSPFIICSAILGGHWNWLWGLVVIAALSLLMTAVGVACAMGLVRAIGPRRTRTVAQVLGAFIGASIMLITQSPNLLGRSRWVVVYGKILGWESRGLGGGWLAWPARAALGDAVPLISLLVISILVFVLLCWSLGRRFADNAAAAAGAGERAHLVRARKGRRAFKAGLMRVMIAKELKLVGRDPTLISQVLLQVIYVVVVTLGIARGSMGRGSALSAAIILPFAAGGLAFLSGQVAAGLGWLTISAEDAPELLLCSPVTVVQVAQAKVAAVVLPVFFILILPAIAIAWLNPWAGLCALGGACLCAAAMGLIELWNQTPGKRSQFRMRRRGTGSAWVYIVEMVINLLIAGAVGLAAGRLIWAFIPAFLALAGVLAMKKDKWLHA